MLVGTDNVQIIKWHMRINPNNLAGLSPLSSSDKDAFAELFTHVMIGLGPRLDAHFFRSIIQPAYGADVNHGVLIVSNSTACKCVLPEQYIIIAWYAGFQPG